MLRILGPLRIGETRLRFASRRAAELLGLLALSSEDSVSRARAVAALWPDAESGRGAQSLRQTLVYLREGLARAGAEDAIVADRERIHLRRPVDAREFARLARGPAERWREALALDDGPLLDGIEGEWAALARDAHADLRRNLLVRLSGAALSSDPEEALRLARLAIEADPLQEDARRAALEAHVALGQRARAVEEFSVYDRLLRGELGLSASPLLRELALGHDEGDAEGEEQPEPPLTPAGRLAVAIGEAARYEAAERYRAGRTALLAALDGSECAAPDARATAFALVARFEFALGDWGASRESARTAVALAIGSGALAFARVQLARALAWTGGHVEAQGLAEAVLRAGKVRRDPELVAEALLTLGAATWFAGDSRGSARIYARAARWAGRADSPAQEARAFLSLASLRMRLAGDEAAAAFAVSAEKAAARSGVPSLTAHARSDLARYREGMGDLEAARRGYAAALVATEGGRDPLARSQVLTYMGDLETRVGRPEAGRAHHSEAVALRRILGDRVGLATSLRGLGRALLALGELGEARLALTESLRHFEAAGALDALATSRLPLAQVLLGLGLPREAERQGRRAIAEWEALSESSRAVQVPDGSLAPKAVAEFRKQFAAAGLVL